VEDRPGVRDVFTKKEEAAIIAIARTAAATPYLIVRTLSDMFGEDMTALGLILQF
jgi:hypothetical protein